MVMKPLILHGHENIEYYTSSTVEIKENRDMKKLLHAHEYYRTIISHASFSEREGDWSAHGIFMPGMAKREREGERERDRERERETERERERERECHVGHACQPGITLSCLA